MRKSHKATTKGARKKGYKLKLNKNAAAQRSKKGWVTKHSRYSYKSELHLPKHTHAEYLPPDDELGGERDRINPRLGQKKGRTSDTDNVKDHQSLIDDRVAAINDLHRAPESLLREAEAAIRAGRDVDDHLMAEYIAKAEAVRRREIEARLEGIKGSDYTRSEQSGARDQFGEILKPIYVRINQRPNSHREERRPHYQTRENAKRSVFGTAFNRVDPITGRGELMAPKEHLDEIVEHIVQSHHARTADEREAAAEAARNLTNQAAQKVIRELDRRALSKKSKAIDEEVQAALGRPAMTQGHGTPNPEYMMENWRAYTTTDRKSVQTGNPTGGVVDSPIGDLNKGIRDLEMAYSKTWKKNPTKAEKRVREELRKHLDKAHEKYQGQKKVYEDALKEGKRRELARKAAIPTEQRLAGTHNVEEYYKYYGHEGATPPEFSQASYIGKTRAQMRMLKQQTERRVKGGLSGDIVMSWDDSRKRTGDHENSLFNLSPNKQWKYRLNRSPDYIERNQGDKTLKFNVSNTDVDKQIAYHKSRAADAHKAGQKTKSWRHTEIAKKLEQDQASLRADIDRTKEAGSRAHREHERVLDYTDRETQFHRAKYDEAGRVIPGDWEEVISEKSQKKLSDAFKVSLGNRGTGEDKPDDVEQERFVVVPGLKKRSTKEVLYGGNQLRTERLVQLGGRWIPATQADWEMRKGSKYTGRSRPTGAARWTEDRVYKHGRIHYIPEHEAKLLGKERDKLSVRVPGFKVGSIEVGERVATLGLNESTDGQKRMNNLLFGYSRAKQHHDLVQQSEEEARARDMRKGNDAAALLAHMKANPEKYTQSQKDRLEPRLKTLAAAGVAASVYGLRRRVKEGYAPQWANRAIDSFRQDNPAVDKWLTQHNAKFFSVNEAYVRPAAEKLANMGFQLRHPLSDPDGETMGIEWGRWKYRQHWIDETTRRSRLLERRSNELDRVMRTRKWFEDNAYTDNPFKKFLVKRKDNQLRHKDYASLTDRGGLLDKALHEARDFRNQATGGSEIEHQANKLAAKVKHIRSLDGNSPAMAERVANWTGSKELAAPRGKHFQSVVNEVTGEAQRLLVNDSVGSHLANFASRHKGFLIGAGVAGAALGTAYGIHKYRESKKPEHERVAFYNKILPPKFSVPVPHVRGTGYVNWGNNTLTRELGVAGRKFPIPVQYGLSISHKDIALRPMDRGYAPNAPLIGGLKFRGPAPGGSLEASLLEHPEAKYNRRRSVTLKGKQVEILGKKVPLYAEIGDRKKMQLSRTNPNRLTQEDRENLVWAYAGTPDETHVKNYYQIGKTDQRLLDMFADEKEVSRIRRKKGTAEAKKYEDLIATMRRQSTERAPRSDEYGSDTGFSESSIGGTETLAFEQAVNSAQGEKWWAEKKARMGQQGVEWR